MKNLFLFLIIFSQSITFAEVKTIEQQIQAMMDQAMRKGNLPALGVLVSQKGKTIFFSTLGKRALQKEALVQANDQWHLGSDTKAMTAFLLALAVQEHQLKFESTLKSILGEGIPFQSANIDLTVADLLSHATGLKDVTEVQDGKLWSGFYTSKKTLTEQRIEMMKAALAEPPHFVGKSLIANRSYSYANVNYIIIGAVLEKIYKTDWENLISVKLFKKLKMDSCGFGVTGLFDETEPSQPWPHFIDKGQLVGFAPKEKLDNPAMLGPAGTVHCNLEDWNKFISELKLTFKSKGQLLKNLEVAKKYFTAAKDSVYTFGGWGRNDERFKSPTFSHNGSNTFNYAIAFFAPEKDLTVLLTTNSAQPMVEAAMTELKKEITELMIQD